MKTAKNTNKIVMNQYLTPSPVFSRIESPLILSALLVGLLILTACGGAAAIPTSFVNPNTFNDGLGDGSGNRQQLDPAQEPVPEPIDGEDWLASFTPPLRGQSSSNPRNVFQQHYSVKTATNKLLLYDLNWQARVFFDGQFLGANGGSSSRGVTLGQKSFTVGSGRSQREEAYYSAGVLAEIKVGLALPVFEAGNPISANWNGGFKTTDYTTEFSEDFTLTVNFRDSTIEAFFKDVYAEIDNYFHLNGSYDTGGIITGTVNYGTFSDIDARTPTDNRANNGILTGIIGQDYAVGAFVSGTSTDGGATITGGTGDDGFAGGFIASSTATYFPNAVTPHDWHRSFATPLSRLRNRTTPRNQFLQVSNGQNSSTLISNDIDGAIRGGTTFDGQPIGISGVRYSRTLIDETPYYYASIQHYRHLVVTDTPLPAYETGNPISANWNGNFSAVNGANTVAGGATRQNQYWPRHATGIDFTLTVNFRDSTIEAFIREGLTSNYYHIKGNYANIAERNADGIITGTVNYGTFSDIDARTPTNNRPNNGVLTGLITKGHAEGVFVSGTSTDGGATITGGTGDDGFAGGFVVTPTATYDPSVTTRDWWRSFASPLSTQPDTTNPRNQFAVSPNQQQRRTGTVLTTFDGASQVTDIPYYGTGVSSQTRFYYALIGGESAGLPLPVFETGNTVSAVWNGKFGALQGVDGKTDTDFTLTVNFRDSTVEAFVKEGDDTSNYYHIEGNYANNAARNADGVITGTVNYGTFSDVDARTPTDNRANNGVLTGIIGQDGARAAFVSGTTSDGGVTITGGTGDDGFAGGFWAGPTVDYLPAVTTSDWRRSFATPLPPVDTTNRRNQFSIESTKIQSENFTTVISTFDGVSQFRNPPRLSTCLGCGGSYFYYADIDGNANLGLPLPVFETGNTVSADWNGHFNAWQGTSSSAGENTDFALTVNFRDSTIEAFVKQGTTSNYYHIEGNYANNTARNADGIITGTVNHGTFSDVDARTPTDSRANNGVLTGLIGQNGAQAVFVSGTTSDGGVTIEGGTTGDGFFGGFWASPTANYIVNRADWTRSFVFSPLPVTDTTNRRNQFVTSLTTSGLTDTDSDSIGGIFFGTGTDDGVQYYYASISNTVNMGCGSA